MSKTAASVTAAAAAATAYGVLQRVSVSQCVAVCCNVLQCVAAGCSVLQFAVCGRVL